jgi:hypothetical protein
MHPNILLDLARAEINERVAEAEARSLARAARPRPSRIARFRPGYARRNCVTE